VTIERIHAAAFTKFTNREGFGTVNPEVHLREDVLYTRHPFYGGNDIVPVYPDLLCSLLPIFILRFLQAYARSDRQYEEDERLDRKGKSRAHRCELPQLEKLRILCIEVVTYVTSPTGNHSSEKGMIYPEYSLY
jgi:hypothetical protein